MNAKPTAKKTTKKTTKKVTKKATKKTPVLLSGGNPQIAKGDGNAPVQAYIAAMPGWKKALGRRLDALVEKAVPNVRKAVKWNSPFYGVAEKTWFLSFHCFNKYIKVAFFRGAGLKPQPPGTSTQKGCAISTFMRVPISTKRNSPLGSSRPASCQASVSRPSRVRARLFSGNSAAPPADR